MHLHAFLLFKEELLTETVMKKIVFTLLLLAFSGSSFSQNQPAHDSCKTAISLDAPSHAEGVNQEYVYLKAHYPQYQVMQQALIQCGNKPTDMFALQDAQGQKIEVYFDLSKYWGKGMGL